MFGAALVCLQQYMEEHLGQAKWQSLLAIAGLPPNKIYYSMRYYPDTEFDQIWKLCAVEMGLSAKEMLRLLGKAFGQYTIQIYGIMLFKNWRALDVIEKAAPIVYKSVQFVDPYTPRSSVKCDRIATNEVVVHYESPRKLCWYICGIIEAMGEHYHEKLEIAQFKCMHFNDLECEIHVKLIEQKAN